MDARTKLLLVICGAAVVVTVHAAVGPNVLLNPGFQTGTIPIASGTITGSRPNSWIDNTDWANPKPTLLYSLVNTNPRTTAGARNWCVKVTSGFAQFGQYVTVKTGSSYTASAWFRVSAAASNAAVRLGLQGAFSPYPVWGSAGRTLRVADKWQQLTIGGLSQLASVPASNTGLLGNALLLLYVDTPGTTVCVDDAFFAEIVCTGQPTLANSNFNCPSSVSVGTACRGSCATGFTGSPTPSSTCLPSGVWGPASGSCVRNCTGNPTNPRNGTFACAPTMVGGRCNATCEVGFYGNPIPSSACNTSALWIPPMGQCSPVTCTTAPTVPSNAVWSCQATAFGGTCTGRCATGFSGTPVATCGASGASGAWTVTGTCSAVTCTAAPTVPLNAVWSCPTTPFGRTCNVSCALGFSGTPVATCGAGGAWTVTGTCSAVMCSTAPTTPSNAVWSCPATAFGGTCGGGCALGFRGTPVATCGAGGAWTITGTCTAVMCASAPTTPTNAVWSCPTTAFGGTCGGSCATGFRGTPVATCGASGTWTVTGTCTAVTCNSQPPQPLYGNLACAVGTAAGGVCNGTCSTGYVGSPAPYALCMATGAWAVLGQCVNAAPQLLVNPGFDQGSTTFSSAGGLISGVRPNSWRDNSDWAIPTPSLLYSLSTSAPRTTGSGNSACVQVTSGFAQLVQSITIKAGTDHSMSAWFRVMAAATPATPVSVSVALQADFSPYNWWGSTDATVSVSSGWSLVTVNKLEQLPQPPSGTVGTNVPALFILRINAPGVTVCMDDAMLQEAAPGPPELLLNAAFDGGTEPRTAAGGSIAGTWPTAWYDNTDWVTPTPTITADVVTAPDARTNKALQLTISNGFSQFVQPTTLQPGTAYRLSIWTKATPPTGLAGVTITLMLRQMGEPYNALAAATAVVGATWTQLFIAAAVVPAGGAPMAVGFFVNTGGPGVVWLDDASLTAIPAATPLPDQVLTPPSNKPIDRSYWCMNINHMWPDDPNSGFGGWAAGYLWPAVDFGIWRTWDSSITWQTLQPTSTTSFDWTRMDRAAGQARSRGQRIMFTLGQSPPWASSNPTEPAVYGPGRGSPPANITHWKTFVTALERGYKGLIMGYEVWNEPNMQGPNGFYNGSPERLSALALATQEVLQAEGSTAWLINPPMAGTAADAINFLGRYYTECRRLGVTHQALAWHSYNMPAELDKESVDTLRSLMAAQGLPADMPLLNTEAGILDGVFAALGNNHTLGAAFLAKTYALNWAVGVSSVCWYAYDAASMEGLTASSYQSTQAALTLNTAGNAYNRVINWLQNATMVSMSRTQGAWLVGLSRSISGSTAVSLSWMAWNGDARVAQLQLAVPAAWGVTAVENLITGVRAAVPVGASVMLGEIPVLLRQT